MERVGEDVAQLFPQLESSASIPGTSTELPPGDDVRARAGSRDQSRQPWHQEQTDDGGTRCSRPSGKLIHRVSGMPARVSKATAGPPSPRRSASPDPAPGSAAPTRRLAMRTPRVPLRQGWPPRGRSQGSGDAVANATPADASSPNRSRHAGASDRTASPAHRRQGRCSRTALGPTSSTTRKTSATSRTGSGGSGRPRCCRHVPTPCNEGGSRCPEGLQDGGCAMERARAETPRG